MAKRKRSGLGLSPPAHLKQARHEETLARREIKFAIGYGKKGMCNAALAASANALQFAAQAQANYEGAIEGRGSPAKILKRAFVVHRALVSRCVSPRGQRKMAKRLRRHLES